MNIEEIFYLTRVGVETSFYKIIEKKEIKHPVVNIQKLFNEYMYVKYLDYTGCMGDYGKSSIAKMNTEFVDNKINLIFTPY